MDVKQSRAVDQSSNVPIPSIPSAHAPIQSAPVGANPTQQAFTTAKTGSSNEGGLRGVVERAVEDENQPIHFYGRVIDQDSNGLPGVEVKSKIEQLTLPDASFSGQELVGSKHVDVVRTTDAAGRFEISGLNGSTFGIGLTKEGYEAEPNHSSFGPVGGSYDDPVIFKMWSTNIHEHLIGANKAFAITPDGRPYFINLTDGTIAESGTGDMKIWVRYANPIVRGQLYEWSAEINIIDGGLLEEPLGSPMYWAPADGYEPSFQSQQQIKGGQYGDIGDRQFYIRLKNGQEYGQMTIDLCAPFNDQTPGLIRLSYVINPSGSRILR
jgi:hypothetical protein